jgi:hypothetical protein
MCNIWLDKQNGKDREKEEERMSMLEKKYIRMQHLRSKNTGSKMLNIQLYDNEY